MAQKGGVYTVTKGLHKAFKGSRVFNTLLDETIILGLAQGYANMGMLPMPEIQYLAYFHNACDQIRGEAAFAAVLLQRPVPQPDGDAHRRRWVTRRASAAISTTTIRSPRLRDIPGLVVGCPAAATMRR